MAKLKIAIDGCEFHTTGTPAEAATELYDQFRLKPKDIRNAHYYKEVGGGDGAWVPLITLRPYASVYTIKSQKNDAVHMFCDNCHMRLDNLSFVRWLNPHAVLDNEGHVVFSCKAE